MAKPSRSYATTHPRLVSVEDDPDFRAILRSWLAPHFEFIQLSEPDGLVEELVALRPDIILMDINLPGLDGIEVCRKLRAHPTTMNTPVLFLSGVSKNDVYLQALGAGMAGFLSKPVRRSELRVSLKALLERGAGLVLALLLLAAPLRAAPPAARANNFGAGVTLGNPTGGTARYFMTSSHALDFGVGYSGDTAVWLDAVWFGWDLFASPEEGHWGPYLGVGGRAEAGDPEIGIRTPAGIGYWVQRYPLEVFAELAPVFVLTGGGYVRLDVGLGARYYFGPSP